MKARINYTVNYTVWVDDISHSYPDDGTGLDYTDKDGMRDHILDIEESNADAFLADEISNGAVEIQVNVDVLEDDL